MSQRIASASLWDNLRYNLCHVIPILLQGTFTRRRFWVGFWTRLQRDPASVRFVHRLRKKLGADYIWINLGGTKTLLVLDPAGVQHVLKQSPAVFADPPAKRKGMNVFQPNAVTISRGDAWQDRRRFNEAVLDSGQSLHRYAGRFLEIIQNEIAPADRRHRTFETWSDFDDLFARITRQIIFGAAARDDTTITGLLKQMMREANRVRKPKKSKHFDDFYARIGSYLNTAEPNTLCVLCKEEHSTEQTRVENQIPHWMFAMWETLAANTVRALALIASHRRVEDDVREEMAEADLATAAGIDGLQLLEGCVQEAMRLWPTTPLLLRQAVQAAELGDETIADSTQVLILNSFNHRDRERYELADTFAPQSWADGHPNTLFNHLSSGTQVCAGKELALFIAKAVLATLLRDHRFILVEPKLNPDRPLPQAYNYFHVRFSCTSQS
jgi:cytochrome P450